MPSHPDWGRLGMVIAASMDNRWQVPAALLEGEGRTIGTLPEKPAGYTGLLKYTVQAPGLEGLCIGLVLGLNTGGGWRHVT